MIDTSCHGIPASRAGHAKSVTHVSEQCYPCLRSIHLALASTSFAGADAEIAEERAILCLRISLFLCNSLRRNCSRRGAEDRSLLRDLRVSACETRGCQAQ